VVVLLNPHIPFRTPFRYERKEQKLDISYLGTVLCARHKNQSRYRFYSLCRSDNKKKKKQHAFHTTIMMGLGIAKHACHEEVRFHTTSTVRSNKLSGRGGLPGKVQQCLDCQAISPSMRFVLVLASDDQQDGPNRRSSGEFLAPIKPRQPQVLTNVTTWRSTSDRERDVQELVPRRQLLLRITTKSPGNGRKRQPLTGGDTGICSAPGTKMLKMSLC